MKKTLFWMLAIVSIVISGSLVYAQENNEHHPMMQMRMDEQNQTDTGELEKGINVGNKICPVTGEKIDEKTKVTYEYQGKIYNFCCAACPDEFKKDPEKYIKKIEEELQTESKQEPSHGKQATETTQGSETMPQGMHEGHQH